MAQLTVGNFAFSMDDLDLQILFEGAVVTRNSTTLAIDVGGGQVERFSGSGFAYNFLGEPVAGTITGFQETLGGQTTFQVTDANVSAVQFYNLAVEGDGAGVFDQFLGGDDNITGSLFGDLMSGFGGHDNILGGSGADSLLGGEGNDHIYGQSAAGGADSADIILGQDGSDYLQGNAGNDTIDGGEGSDRINGGANDDLIVGGAGNDTVNGNLGNDSIAGQDGNDSIRGGQGNDSLQGNDGNDVLFGDLGVDTLIGGGGSDLFMFSGNAALFANASADTIADFQDGTDRIAVGYAPAAVLTGAVQVSFSTAAAAAQQLFDANAANGEVVALKVGSDTYLFYSSNAGANADSAVQLIGIDPAALGSADFG